MRGGVFMLRKLPGREIDGVVSTRIDGSVVFQPTVLRTPAIVVILIWAWRLLAGVVKTVVRHPVGCGLLGGAAGLAYVGGWRLAAMVAAGLALVLGVWAALGRRSWGRWIGWPLVGWWRWLWIYRR